MDAALASFVWGFNRPAVPRAPGVQGGRGAPRSRSGERVGGRQSDEDVPGLSTPTCLRAVYVRHLLELCPERCVS